MVKSRVIRIGIVNLLKVVIAGIIIGLLRKQENLVLILLGALIIYDLVRKSNHNKRLLLFGMLLTGTLGVIIESFGTYYNYWEYHDIRWNIPTYLFFVWMLAFRFLYSIERKMLLEFEGASYFKNILICSLIVIIYPTIGEIVTIYFGVWTYYVPYMFLGVSHYTILSIALVHLTINYLLSLYCKRVKVNDIVFNAG